ncbi:MAG TPA: DUF664 domain-containing protein [Frankiaceae bacterium]|jgi:hypothetical protein|nr:DUF664 domain-containing protein [Frankiaceae bacterium]
MASADVLVDAFERVRGVVHEAVDGLTPEQLTVRLDDESNSIGWLVWHLTRIQDDHIADAAGIPQVWTSKGWYERFGLPFDAGETGYGMDHEQVSAVKVSSGELLTGYYEEVHQQTLDYVRRLPDSELTRVVDERWSPPVQLGVRLVSVISDDLQHAGQAAFVRGLIS